VAARLAVTTATAHHAAQQEAAHKSCPKRNQRPLLDLLLEIHVLLHSLDRVIHRPFYLIDHLLGGVLYLPAHVIRGALHLILQLVDLAGRIIAMLIYFLTDLI
jgi:hypothetical protein